jgi:hypothetical protein
MAEGDVCGRDTHELGGGGSGGMLPQKSFEI